MQLTLTTDYAVRIVHYLAIEGDINNAGEMAEALNIPASYVPKVTLLLKKAGIITALEGNGGGYHLSRKPKDITLMDIICATEKTMCINRCLEPDNHCSRKATEGCPVRKVYAVIQDKMEAYFSHITLADLL